MGYCPPCQSLAVAIVQWDFVLKCVSTDGVTVIGCREYFSALSGLLDGSCINVGYSTASAHKPGRMNYMQTIRCEHEQRLP